MNGGKTNTRLDSVRFMVHDMIMSIPCEARKQEACAHLFGVSAFAAMLAMKRRLNQELAAIGGLLHNCYFYKTGVNDFPGPNSSEAVRPLLRDFHELAIPNDFSVEEHSLGNVDDRQDANKRSNLADIAEALAGSHIVGVAGDQRYRKVCSYWPDTGIYKELQNEWCAAFVYHCCRQAGFQLPIRYPNGRCRFAGVGAWLEWAQLPETGFLYQDGRSGFVPQRGDIVIYEKLLSDDSHDHIGIVLACHEEEIVVAEGNRDNQNYSSVFNRDRRHCILGYIRIDNDYTFQFNGEYNPIQSI